MIIVMERHACINMNINITSEISYRKDWTRQNLNLAGYMGGKQISYPY